MTSTTVRRDVIDDSRASFLLGVPKEQLREICEMSGLGQLEEAEIMDQGMSDARMLFTYEELYRLCRLLVGPTS